MESDNIQKKRSYILISPNEKQRLLSKKTTPNSLCKCGSGKKSKKCCGFKTEYYSVN